MRRHLFALACLIPTITFAFNDGSPYDSPLGEILEDCKSAVALADNGNVRDFYDSKCALRISTAMNTASIVLSKPAYCIPSKDPKEIYADQRLDDYVATKTSEWCGIQEVKNSLKDKDGYLEVELARRFIRKQEEDIKTYHRKLDTTSPSPYSMMLAFRPPCNLGTP